MGRIAGVTAEETRSRLLDAAAIVFAQRGYEGASIAEICSEAGLSSGAIYAHYGSKAMLFGAVLEAHGTQAFDRLLGGAQVDDVGALFTILGSALDAREDADDPPLLVEAIVAAKRDPEIAALLVAGFRQRETFLAELVRLGQDQHSIDASISPAAVARLALMLAFGSLLTSALALPPTDRGDWSQMIAQLVHTFRTPAHKES